MARRRDRDPLQIDLSPDDGDLGDGGWTDAPDGSAGVPTDGPVDPAPGWFATRVARPLHERWRGVPRRLRVGVVSGAAAVVAVTVAGVAVVDARAESAHAERMAALPGGVADLSEPVAETWRVETDAGVLAVLPGGVVVTQVGTDVLGVDVADGSEVWRHELGPAIDCGPRSWRPSDEHLPVDRITCVYGEGMRTAVVIDAEGALLGERRLGMADRPYSEGNGGISEVGPAADGAVYVLDRVEAMLPPDAQEAVDQLELLRAEGTWEDPVLRVEDALTGEVRGEASIVLRTADELGRCSLGAGSDGDAERRFIVDAWPSTAATQLSVCDGAVTRTLAADGTSLEQVVLPSVDGGSYSFVHGGTRVLGDDGGADLALPGILIEPLAIDASDGPWLVGGAELAAFDRTGEQLWASDIPAGTVFARSGGVAVIGGITELGLTAVDLVSGEARWTGDELFASDVGGATGLAIGAATDGEAVLLAVQSAEKTELVALRLDDGAELWRTGHQALNRGILTVDGHLLGVDEEHSVVDGVEISDAVLVGLGPAS